MKVFITYLKEFLHNSHFRNLIFTILFVGLLTGLNYSYGIERRIRDLHPWWLSLISFFFFYGFVLFFTWGLQYSFGARVAGGSKRRLLLLILLAPLFFAFKMIHWDLSVLLPAACNGAWKAYAL